MVEFGREGFGKKGGGEKIAFFVRRFTGRFGEVGLCLIPNTAAPTALAAVFTGVD
jgi:hypothetical protein